MQAGNWCQSWSQTRAWCQDVLLHCGKGLGKQNVWGTLSLPKIKTHLVPQWWLRQTFMDIDVRNRQADEVVGAISQWFRFGFFPIFLCPWLTRFQWVGNWECEEIRQRWVKQIFQELAEITYSITHDLNKVCVCCLLNWQFIMHLEIFNFTGNIKRLKN